MRKMLSLIALATVLLCPSVISDLDPPTNVYHGNVFKLKVNADSWIDNTGTNHNNDNFLSIGQNAGSTIKRVLLKFETINSNPGALDCAVDKIRWAQMYVHFNEPYDDTANTKEISYRLLVHRVKKEWNKAQVTGVKRLTTTPWATPMLGITTGEDAEREPQSSIPTTIFANRPMQQFIEFNVTKAVRHWAANPSQNYGVLVYASNEGEAGRDLRFTTESGAASERAFINVMCDY